jgi:DNA replication and repair protein RecF
MVSKLLVRDFRCFSKLEIEFHPELTCVIGKNAVGKTSLLEAISVLARLQSPRTNSLAQLIRLGAKGLVVDGYIADYHLQYYYSATRRKLSLDAVEQKKNSDYLNIARVVYFANSDVELVRGTGEPRRGFLDFVGSQLFRNYQEINRSYEKALRARNFCLKMMPVRPKELAAYTKTLLSYGHQLTALRAFLVERLEPFVVEAYGSISDRAEPLSIRYRAGATDDFEGALEASSEQEARLHATVVGPHRDDMQMLLYSHPAELFASEGQQRTMAISLKLAQAKLLELEFRAEPILLLDDIFGELDHARRNRLVAALPKRGQRIITTTSLEWLSETPTGSFYELIENAGIRDLRKLSSGESGRP